MSIKSSNKQKWVSLSYFEYSAKFVKNIISKQYYNQLLKTIMESKKLRSKIIEQYNMLWHLWS